MTKAIVTGAAGFIGSHLAEACLRKGWEVTAIDGLTPYYGPDIKRRNVAAIAAHPRCLYVEQDLESLDLPRVLRGADIVFHLAAQAGVRSSWGQSFEVYTRLNITALQLLLEAVKGADVSKFVFASSSSVYGDAEALPSSEDSVLRPISPYGATKALGEHLVYLYWRSYGLPGVSLRYFTVYGPRQRPDMAFHRAIATARRGKAFTLYGSGEQTRDFTYVGDAVQGTVAAGLRGRAGSIYNIGGGARTSMNEVIGILDRFFDGGLRVHRAGSQRGDMRDTAADITRARDELGYVPSTGLEEGLRYQLEWQTGTTLPLGSIAVSQLSRVQR